MEVFTKEMIADQFLDVDDTGIDRLIEHLVHIAPTIDFVFSIADGVPSLHYSSRIDIFCRR